VPEADLPRFAKGRRWDRDPDFDARVSALKTARDEMAGKLDMDPGVLCAKDRLEAVARRSPETAEQLGEVSELRNWQREALGPAFLSALKPHRADSPYRDS
ncbi:MAG: HRDC domain-containing protein, partial [Gemmatimonadota bacterium]|nr:HRDC domain-containing protein [Gemmatimonadota bacterium]